TVTNVMPAITSPDDVTYEEGTTGNAITWRVTDASTGATAYSVYRNGTQVNTGSWVPGNIVVIPIDGLLKGEYNFTIVAMDGFGGSIQDEVVVVVVGSTPSTPSAVPGYPRLALLVFASLGIVLLLTRQRRRRLR
ncbi:MAG: hypothetical protein JW839_07895, partial [Candidatus Lokiarchaeota archaeon]|nr:hypothetical protein [Candidatus Lokiarchaeota archaeon]